MNKQKIICRITYHNWRYVDRYLYVDLQKCFYCGELRRITNPIPCVGPSDHWNAFCTIHQFATGRKFTRLTHEKITYDMYRWWLKLKLIRAITEKENG